MKILLIVDVQQFFINEHTKHIPHKIVEFIKSHKFDKIYFFQFFNRPDSNFVKFHNWQKMYCPPETDLVLELQSFVNARNVFSKHSFSVFNISEFNKLVKKFINPEMLICGFDTDACVLISEMEAFEFGYNAKVIEDLCASHWGEEYHQKALDIIRKNLGNRSVVKSDDIK